MRSLDNFLVMLASKQGVENAVKCTQTCTVVMSADSTYRLNWSAFPTLVIGVVDARQRFHPVIVALAKKETTQIWTETFEAFFKLMEEHGKMDWKQVERLYTMSDACKMIRKGLAAALVTMEDILPSRKVTKLSCFFHIKQSFTKKKTNLMKSPHYRPVCSLWAGTP
jgi:hypothetical protein